MIRPFSISSLHIFRGNEWGSRLDTMFDRHQHRPMFSIASQQCGVVSSLWTWLQDASEHSIALVGWHNFVRTASRVQMKMVKFAEAFR